MDKDEWSPMPLRGRLDYLIEQSFKDEPETIAAVKRMYDEPPKCATVEWDAEMLALVENLAIEDHANVGELKSIQDDLHKKIVDALNSQRAAAQKSRRDRKAARKKARAKAKAKAKAKPKFTKGKFAQGVGKGKSPLKLAGVPEAAPAAAAVADAPIAHGPPLVVHGDWKATRYMGHELRVSATAFTVSGHCNDPRHKGKTKCKIDRSLTKCPLALIGEWLANHADNPDKAATDKSTHDNMKKTLSSADEWDARKKRRRLMRDLDDDVIKDIIRLEGDVAPEDEPLCIA